MVNFNTCVNSVYLRSVCLVSSWMVLRCWFDARKNVCPAPLITRDLLREASEASVENWKLIAADWQTHTQWDCLWCSLKMEYEKLAQEKTEMQRHYVMVCLFVCLHLSVCLSTPLSHFICMYCSCFIKFKCFVTEDVTSKTLEQS